MEGGAYCWGEVEDSALLDGVPTVPCLFVSNYTSQICAQEPSRVAAGHIFTEMGVGENFACGLTPEGEVYCWGFYGNGRLGVKAVNEVCGSEYSKRTYACVAAPVPVPSEVAPPLT